MNQRDDDAKYNLVEIITLAEMITTIIAFVMVKN